MSLEHGLISKTYVFALLVILNSACGGGSDSGNSSSPVTQTATVTNSAPIADAGDDQTVVVYTQVQLSAENSTDADGDSLSYTWSIRSQPNNSLVNLSSTNTRETNLTPDIVGNYIIEVIVNDGSTDSQADTLEITVQDDVTSTGKIPLDGSLNIMVIIGDDIGVDNISGYKEQPTYSAQTPSIDALAEQGVMFKNTWANPMCSPSRASILTGKYAFKHGVTSPGKSHGSLSSDEKTIAEYLSQVGYKTALFGKWHLGNSEEQLPTSQGFDYFSGSVANIDDYFSWQKTMSDGQHSSSNVVDETQYATEVTAIEAANWINQQTTPWFTQIAFNAPHPPFHVPPQNTYTNANLNGMVGDECTNNGSNDEPKDCYRAAAESMDYYINQILTTISPEQLAQTVIIFIGDNGTPGGVTIEEAGTPFSSAHAKGTVYEGGINVPMIMWGGADTGVDRSGFPINNLTLAQDIFSTTVALAGIAIEDNTIDGMNLIGYLDNETATPDAREIYYSELYNEADNIDRWTISNGELKYINNEGSEECYNLLADASEQNNIIEQFDTQTQCNDLKSIRPLN